MEGEEQSDGAGTGFVGGFGTWTFVFLAGRAAVTGYNVLKDWQLMLLKIS